MSKKQKQDELGDTGELAATYANNTLLESSVWDLKIFFGQWYNKPGVDWHTAVVLPWAQVKLLSHYLKVNLAVYEAQNGAVRVPSAMAQSLPEPPEGTTHEERHIVELVQKMHREFFGLSQEGDNAEQK